VTLLIISCLIFHLRRDKFDEESLLKTQPSMIYTCGTVRLTFFTWCEINRLCMDDACSRSGAGVVSVVAGSIPRCTMMILHKRSSILRNVGDTPGRHPRARRRGRPAHTGLFAEPTLCSLFLPVTNSKGAFYGDSAQFGKQLAGAVFIVVWN
jgi:hypothetical protein